MERKCRTCKWWDNTASFNKAKGKCREFPPETKRTDVGLEALWPVTDAEDWCGHWFGVSDDGCGH